MDCFALFGKIINGSGSPREWHYGHVFLISKTTPVYPGIPRSANRWFLFRGRGKDVVSTFPRLREAERAVADEHARAGSAAGQLSALRTEHSQLLAAFAEHDAGTMSSPPQVRRAQRARLGCIV